MPKVYCDRMANGPELCSLSELLSMVSSKQCLSSSSKLFTLVSHAILIFQQINSCFQFWHNISKQQHNVPSQLRFIMPGFPKQIHLSVIKRLVLVQPGASSINQLVISSCIVYSSIYFDTQSQSQFRQSYLTNFNFYWKCDA